MPATHLLHVGYGLYWYTECCLCSITTPCSQSGISLVSRLIFEGNLPLMLTQALVALAQIFPYYLNAYDYYIMNTAIKAEFFGVILSIYAYKSLHYFDLILKELACKSFR